MRIAVCDNESYFVNDIIERVKKHNIDDGTHNQIDGYLNPKDLLDNFDREDYDLVYLDVNMNDMNGIEVAKEIHKRKSKCIIIFISGYIQYVHDSYHVDAFQFITKPINDELFNRELQRAVKKFKNMNRAILFLTSDGKKYIKTKDILYIETSYRKYRICSTTPKKSYYGNSKNILRTKKELLKYNFYLINRSFLINMDYVDYIGQEEITMINGKPIMVSRKHWRDFKNVYFKYLDQ